MNLTLNSQENREKSKLHIAKSILEMHTRGEFNNLSRNVQVQEKQDEQENKNKRSLESSIIQSIPSFANFFNFIDFLLTKSDYTKGAYISGDVGISKSHYIIKKLNDIVGADSFIVFNTTITPLALFRCLHENRTKTVVFDDTAGLFEPKAMSVLRSALFSVDNVRVVRWQSTSKILQDEEIPNSFVFEGRIIIIQNKAERDIGDELQALLSRLYCYDLRLTLEEKTKLISLVLHSRSFFNLSQAQTKRLCAFLESLANFSNHTKYNLRTAIQCAELYAKLGEARAQPLILEILETEPLLAKFLRIEETCKELSVKQRIAIFTDSTGYSRRTYFLIKDRYYKAKFSKSNLEKQSLEDLDQRINLAKQNLI